MSDNLFNNSHQLLYLASLEGIRTSQKSTIFYSKLFTGLFGKSTAAIGGRVAKYPKGAEYSKSSKHAKGKPQLNGFLSDSKGGFDLDSFRSCTVVNHAKNTLQHQGLLPLREAHCKVPLNPATKRKIDKQNIFIGFGEGWERVSEANKKDVWRAEEGVEPQSNWSRTAVTLRIFEIILSMLEVMQAIVTRERIRT